MRASQAWVLSAGLALGLGGCGDPRHEQALAKRANGLADTAEVMKEHETDRGRNLRNTLGVAAEKYQEDVQRTARAPATINERIGEELEKWRAREPYRRRVFQEQIEGHPANINRDLPDVLY